MSELTTARNMLANFLLYESERRIMQDISNFKQGNMTLQAFNSKYHKSYSNVTNALASIRRMYNTLLNQSEIPRQISLAERIKEAYLNVQQPTRQRKREVFTNQQISYRRFLELSDNFGFYTSRNNANKRWDSVEGLQSGNRMSYDFRTKLPITLDSRTEWVSVVKNVMKFLKDLYETRQWFGDFMIIIEYTNLQSIVIPNDSDFNFEGWLESDAISGFAATRRNSSFRFHEAQLIELIDNILSELSQGNSEYYSSEIETMGIVRFGIMLFEVFIPSEDHFSFRGEFR